MSKSYNTNASQEKELWPCPAKLNLFLHIVGQRDNGYHNLQSVFQLIDYCDYLEIKTNQSGDLKFNCDRRELSGADNLVVSAAKKLQAYASNYLAKNNLGADIYLHKNLPVGGGVGGGSSNCATALIALNHLWDLQLSLQQLKAIGLSLGADVPIFIMGNSAFVEGIGEILTPIQIPEYWYLVVHPQCHVSTQKIFSNPLLTRDNKIIRIRDLDIRALPFKGFNCMQDVVLNEYPEVKKALNWLKQVNPNARMTGSGSCVFAAFDNQREMSKIASQCEWPHFLAKGLNQSPVHIKMQNNKSV